MTRTVLACSTLALSLLAGCQSTAQFMTQTQPKAISAAEARGRFELDCPVATAQVLNEQDVQPELRAVRFQAPDRAVYTIGVSGCNKRVTYVVVCPDDGSGNCFAADGRR